MKSYYVKEFWNIFYEVRYCIVDKKTGRVLDDANGYGYKSAYKAHKAYGYKLYHVNNT